MFDTQWVLLTEKIQIIFFWSQFETLKNNLINFFGSWFNSICLKKNLRDYQIKSPVKTRIFQLKNISLLWRWFSWCNLRIQWALPLIWFLNIHFFSAESREGERREIFKKIKQKIYFNKKITKLKLFNLEENR
jgi:hypothetical protein